MPNGKGYKNRPESFYQPTKENERTREGQSDASHHGGPLPFEKGAFGTNTAGSDYHDLSRQDSGLHGNFAQKDAHIKALKDAGQHGQYIRHFSGTHRPADFQTNAHGVTAYNSSPIPETYQPATSHGLPDPAPVQYKPTEPSDFSDTKEVDNDSDMLKKRKK